MDMHKHTLYTLSFYVAYATPWWLQISLHPLIQIESESIFSFNSATLSKTLNAFQLPPLFSLAFYQLAL